jgi:hypothetical protein
MATYYNVGREVNPITTPASAWMRAAQGARKDTGGLAFSAGGATMSAPHVGWALQPALNTRTVPYTPAYDVYSSEAKGLSAQVVDGGMRIENNYVEPSDGYGYGGSNAIADHYKAPNALSLYAYRYSPTTYSASIGTTHGTVS